MPVSVHIRKAAECKDNGINSSNSNSAIMLAKLDLLFLIGCLLYAGAVLSIIKLLKFVAS